MRENSLAWFIAENSTERGRLNADNQDLADDWYALTGEKLTNKNGSWIRPNGEALYKLSKDEVATTIVDEMKKNAKAWNSANGSERSSLEERNESLAIVLQNYLGQRITKSRDGVWWIGNQKLFDAYHSGGVVGGASLKQNEVLAVLENGEAVLDHKKEKGLYRVIDIFEHLSSVLGHKIDEGMVSKAFSDTKVVKPAFTASASQNPIERNNNTIVSIDPEIYLEINHYGEMTDADAKKFGNMAAEHALSELRSAFAKKGLNSIGSSLLRE